MANSAGTRESIWTAPAPTPYPSLPGDYEADVAVIGAGIVGLTAAHFLRQAGASVVVLEAQRAGRQVTGLSTAKVTSQHGLIYARLAQSHGPDAAQAYATAQQSGLHALATIVHDLAIECRFEWRSAYVYAATEERVADVEREASAAERLGLPARFTGSAPLPFPVAGAVVFDDQAQFDPYAYLQGLAARFAAGGALFEETRVTHVQHGEPCRVITDRGTVTAKDVIVATHLPILDRGLFFTRAYPVGHAVIGARIVPPGPDGMFISAERPARSIRTATDERGTWLVLAGGGFTPGPDVDEAEEFRALETFARAHFPVMAVQYRWTNEDYDSADGVPFVGRLAPGQQHLYVATGFGGWGFTNGTTAARILANAILGEEHPQAWLFDAMRLKPVLSARRFLAENLKVAREAVAGRVTRADEVSLDAIGPGEGVVGELDGRKVAVSRDEAGSLHAVSAICTHLGCVVGWNNAMRTWDCPCHGSVFDPDGEVLHGPAVHDLARLPLPVRARAGD